MMNAYNRAIALVRIIMKEEYDFSNAERSKFYRPDAQLNILIYLDLDLNIEN